MDPLSITASAVALTTFCTQIVTTLSQFVSDSTRVDATVERFSDEITGLSQVLRSISISFADPSVSSLPALTGHEGQHWRDVQRSLGDCKASMERLAKILEKVKAAAEGKGVLKRARKQLTLNMRAGEIVTLRSQIVSYTQTIQISLQMISLSSQIADRSATAAIAPRLDDLTEEIRSVLATLRISLQDSNGLQDIPSDCDTRSEAEQQDTVEVDPCNTITDTEFLEMNHTVIANLSTCVISAGKIVSTASTLLTTSSRGEGSVCGSDFGDVLTHDRRRYVESWIPAKDAGIYSSGSSTLAQSDEQPISDAPGLDEDDSDSDVESDVIKSLQKTGRQRFEAAEYSEAEGFLQKSIHLLETKKGLDFDGRDEMFDMLVTSLLNQKKWREAETALLHFIEVRSERDSKTLDSFSVLAEVYLENGQLEEAEKYCLRAVKGRKKALGRGHPLFLESVDLLIEIYERKGDIVAARGYTATFFPDGFRIGGRAWKNATRMLLDKGFRLEKMDQTSKSQALRWAATEGHVNVVRVLIGKDAGIREIVDVKDRVGKTALHLASLAGHHLICKLLLENGADLETRAACSMTSIHLAAVEGHEQAVKVLLDHGAEIDRITHTGETALHSAVKNGHLNVVNLLLARGANIEASDYRKSRALHMACTRGQTPVVRLLLEHRADVKAEDMEGGTPLHRASWYGQEHSVNLLLEHDANIEARGVAGGTPLRGAAMNGHDMVVAILLTHGANTEVRNDSGKTMLDEAAKRGHRNIVHMLQSVRRG